MGGWVGRAREACERVGERELQRALTLYSFISAGSTVKGAQVSATMAMATVVQTRFWRS